MKWIQSVLIVALSVLLVLVSRQNTKIAAEYKQVVQASAEVHRLYRESLARCEARGSVP